MNVVEPYNRILCAAHLFCGFDYFKTTTGGIAKFNLKEYTFTSPDFIINFEADAISVSCFILAAKKPCSTAIIRYLLATALDRFSITANFIATLQPITSATVPIELNFIANQINTFDLTLVFNRSNANTLISGYVRIPNVAVGNEL